MATWGVNIGRTWPGFENWPRVSLGTEAEMARFREAFTAVVAGKLGPVTPPKRRTASLETPAGLLHQASFQGGADRMPMLHSC
jgi:histidinol-phosphate aminotransferase